MRFELEEMQLGENTIGRLNLFPSDERGVFQIDHPYYKQRAVGKMGLAGLTQDEVDSVVSGDSSINDFFTLSRDGLVVTSDERIVPLALIDSDAGVNSVTVEVRGFCEMSRVAIRDM